MIGTVILKYNDNKFLLNDQSNKFFISRKSRMINVEEIVKKNGIFDRER